MLRSRTIATHAGGSRGAFVAADADDDVQFVIVAAAERARAAIAIDSELQDEGRAGCV